MERKKYINRNIVYVGLSFLIIFMYKEAFDLSLPLILTYRFGVQGFRYELAVIMDDLFGFLIFPVFGLLSDRVRSKQGKRSPLITIGTLVGVLSVLAYAYSINWQESLIQEYGSSMELSEITAENPAAYVFFIGLLILSLFAVALVTVPSYALVCDVSDDESRGPVFAVMNLFGGLGYFIALLFGIICSSGLEGGEKIHFSRYLAVLALVAFAAFLYFRLNVREKSSIDAGEEIRRKYGIVEERVEEPSGNLEKREKISYVFILLTILFWNGAYRILTDNITDFSSKVYERDNLNFLAVAVAVALLSFLPIAFLTLKLGRKRAILLGVLIELSTSLVLPFANDGGHLPVAYAVFVLMGLSWGFININLFPMAMQYSDKKRFGFYCGLYFATYSLGQSVAPNLYDFFRRTHGDESLFLFISIFVILTGICMFHVGNSKQESPM